MLGTLVKAGFGVLLQVPVVREFAGQATDKVTEILKSHFLDSSYEIGSAFQESYGYALVAIASGLASEQEMQSMWSRLVAGVKKAAESNISKEFSTELQTHYLVPFASTHGLSGAALTQFCEQSIVFCKEIAAQREAVLPLNLFGELDWAELVNQSLSLEVSGLLIERPPLVKLDDKVSDFLQYNGLLGDAMLHFFREQMRRNERVESTLAALQKETVPPALPICGHRGRVCVRNKRAGRVGREKRGVWGAIY